MKKCKTNNVANKSYIDISALSSLRSASEIQNMNENCVKLKVLKGSISNKRITIKGGGFWKKPKMSQVTGITYKKADITQKKIKL